MKWRSAVVTAVWVCAFAGAGGLGAWSLANTDMGVRNSRAEPLDDDGVRQKLAAARTSAQPPGSSDPGSGASESGATDSGGSGTPSGGATPSPGGASSPGSAARVGTVNVTGGSATAECRPDGTVYLTVWSPASGYHMDSVKRGPSDVATIEFEPLDDGDDLTYAVRCDDGRPKAVPIADHDIDHDDDDDDD
ncbi:hypothetical protein [Streptomyces ochraceiscleroticus]|uniref:Septum formation initiator n=1 Tax=Streptomyces ochraceiscleroticus TaxID=47761 RepID=A0ABW1MN08_9ACTN|nr:hypothetical protein [Streptomyces ochraceiscleroticus]